MGAKCSVRRGFDAASLVHLVLVVEGLMASSFRRPHTMQDKEATQRRSPMSTPAQGLPGIPTAQAWSWCPCPQSWCQHTSRPGSKPQQCPCHGPCLPHCSSMNLGVQESHWQANQRGAICAPEGIFLLHSKLGVLVAHHVHCLFTGVP